MQQAQDQDIQQAINGSISNGKVEAEKVEERLQTQGFENNARMRRRINALLGEKGWQYLGAGEYQVRG